MKLFILTFRPGSSYQPQKIKNQCRCGERVRLKMTLPAVFSRLFCFFFRKNTISGKTRPLKRFIFRSCLTIFVQVSQCQFFWGGGGGDDDVVTTRRRDDATSLRLPGPCPITPRDRIPREGPPHFDLKMKSFTHLVKLTIFIFGFSGYTSIF